MDSNVESLYGIEKAVSLAGVEPRREGADCLGSIKKLVLWKEEEVLLVCGQWRNLWL